jgi:branched-chain amino acid transport system ATP-binding protein
MIELNGVSTRYGSVPMLRDVSLRVGAGELVCLLGPNGAGKTTLFKTVAGLIRPTAGAVQIMDAAPNLRTERIARLGVGFVPENRRLFAGLTVAQNLRLGYEAVCGSGSGFAGGLQEIGRLFPRVQERLDQVAGTLSGGEQAMVALARALIGRPKLLIMDEPSLGLAPKLISEYFRIVKRLHADGATVLLIEQNAEMALRIAQRGYVLSRGTVVAADAAAALRQSSVVRHLYFS